MDQWTRFGGILTALLCACHSQNTIFIPAMEIEGAEVLLLVVLSQGKPDLSRSRVVLPQLEASASTDLGLEGGESLVLASFDRAALDRGVPGVMDLTADNVKLHAPSGVDCGARGADVTPTPSETTQIQQPIHRFEPKLQLVEPEANTPLPTDLSSFPSIAELELELPVDPEPCRSQIRLELVPFTEGGLFPNGIEVPDPLLDPSYYTRVSSPRPYDQTRWFLLSAGGIYFVRRGSGFDPAIDRAFFIGRDTDLPVSVEGVWVVHSALVFEGPTPATRRILMLLREVITEQNAGRGWALLEVPFDGTDFQAARLRWRYEVGGTSAVGGAAMTEDPSGAIVAAGMEGSWAFAESIDDEFVGGSVNRGDFELVVNAPDAEAPHLVAIRGGNFGLGRMMNPNELEIHRVRTESSASRLFFTYELGKDWLYSGWKDGRVFKTEYSARPLVLESVPVELPRRLEFCPRSIPDRCGRTTPVGWNYGLVVFTKYGREPLLVGLFGDCPSVLVHQFSTGCTTSVEFPDQRPSAPAGMSLTEVEDTIFVTDGNGTPFELRLQGP